MIDDMRAEWSEDTFVVYVHDKYRGVDREGREYLVDYDVNNENPDGLVCNLLRTDGCVCRLPRGHRRSHMPFSVDVAVVLGMYVVHIQEDAVQ